MKQIVGALAILAVLLVVIGCAGLSPAHTKEYLNGIAVLTPDFSAKYDAVYAGSYKVALPRGAMAAFRSVSVEVTLKGGHIESIMITKPRQLASGKFYDAIVAGPSGVIARQSLDVDAVSGVSYSSKAFLKAVENALSK
jgi:uncharacterized protein with FMN-binding domain